MSISTLQISGRRFVVIPEDEYNRLASRGPAARLLPALPQRDASGRMPAVAYARATLARKIIAGRNAAGWSQAELARRAGVRPETVNRIEHGKNTPDVATIAKLERAMVKAGVRF